jgi:hypothetical protein
MDTLRIQKCLFILLISVGALLALSADVAAQDHVVVQPRRMVIIRTGKVVRDFPKRKRATVRYPIVKGLTDASALRRLQNTLSMKNVFDSTLVDYRTEPGLISFDYEVDYNKNYLLDITFTQETEGAYPDTQRKHFLINLKNGRIIKAADAFNQGSLPTLTRMANEKLKVEVKELVKVVEEEKDSDADQKSAVKDQLHQLEFKLGNLDDFATSDKGVTFLYDAGFPHVIRALQPNGEYFFSFAELRPYIKSNGPLGIFK